MSKEIIRCEWCGTDPDYVAYHDNEWGVPLRDDQKLFELLCLEGAQAGLSWLTILRKREGYRLLFDNFDAEKIAAYDETKIQELLQDARIVRNKLKVNAFVGNARAYLDNLASGTSFSDYLWQFVDGEPIQNSFESLSEIPASTQLSDAMSKQLKRDGFKFVGSTICYAFMQSAGLVNDHIVSCFRHEEVKRLSQP